ncbi:MAG: GatB/YqeY domain-containing protein [Myxococcota bacterium]|nr:GatB/YqeY domain-containing protein [Myxococcota bacterium]
MDLRQRLEADMKEALRARDAVRLETIRGARGAIRNREIEQGEALDDDGILRVLRSLLKQRADSIEQYSAAGRDDLVEKESAEKAVLEAYLPAAPDEASVERAVREVIAEVGAEGPRDMGRVMKPALERLGPAADGKLVSQVVKRLLGEGAGR